MQTLMKCSIMLHLGVHCLPKYPFRGFQYTRDVFYVRREVDLMKTAKVNAYIMHTLGKIELLSIHAT